MNCEGEGEGGKRVIGVAPYRKAKIGGDKAELRLSVLIEKMCGTQRPKIRCFFCFELAERSTEQACNRLRKMAKTPKPKNRGICLSLHLNGNC